MNKLDLTKPLVTSQDRPVTFAYERPGLPPEDKRKLVVIVDDDRAYSCDAYGNTGRSFIILNKLQTDSDPDTVAPV